ncbi:hypothetical protein L6164_024266 [Bauhinia variegata]|uniref:Uncharacterized protein n=1 Tax=Bauhinia variegata TaxID=167791 RepID=A0ACB9LXY3_BAUVA|nr:hypothetical protein L6164_024266 [Bauhinia variegata]
MINCQFDYYTRGRVIYNWVGTIASTLPLRLWKEEKSSSRSKTVKYKTFWVLQFKSLSVLVLSYLGGLYDYISVQA